MPDAAATPAYLVKDWRIGLCVTLGAIAFGFASVVLELIELWATKADYSHGFLVLPFVGYLLYRWRASFPTKVKWPDPWGLPFFAVAIGMYFESDKLNIAREWQQGMALVLALAGTAVMFCGRWQGLLWAGPALLFFPLVFPLPHKIEQVISLKLRDIATEGANFLFQTVGLPSYVAGNEIVIGNTRLEVALACAGLSMLLAFVAMAAAIVVLSEKRPWIDRLIVMLCAIPIAVFCNVLRIFVTGLIYHAGWKQFGDLVVHDMAGWLMMPLALGLVWVVLRLLNWIAEPVERVSTTEALGLGIRRLPTLPVPPAASP